MTRFEAQDFEVSIGGVTRRVPSDGGPRHHAMYQLESPEVLTSSAWSDAVERGRWPEQVRPYTKNRRHVLLRITYPEA